MAWADKYRTMKVRNQCRYSGRCEESPRAGCGRHRLCRTEHMFFEGNRIDAFREMICSETVEEREAALEKILPEQQGDFEKLYEALEGNPVTIRFLDPPLHEFVPTDEEDIKKLADAQGKSVEKIKAIINSLHEFNPMMGHRGCRLAVTYPEIAKNADQGCYPRGDQCEEGSSGLDHRAGNHDSAGWRHQRAEICEEIRS